MITPISVPEPAVPELAAARPNFAGYGEGWSLSDYRAIGWCGTPEVGRAWCRG